MNEEQNKTQEQNPEQNTQNVQGAQVTETPVTTVDSTPKVEQPLTPTSPVASQFSTSMEEIQNLFNARQQVAQQMVENAKQRLSYPTSGYEDILAQITPEEQVVNFDPQREQSRMNLANIGTALSAVANLVGASNGGVAFKPSNLSEAAGKRYETLYKMSQDNRKEREAAIERARNQAMQIANFQNNIRKNRIAEEEAYDKARLGLATDAYANAVDMRNREVDEENNRVNNMYKLMTGAAAQTRADRTGIQTPKEPKAPTPPKGENYVGSDGKSYNVPKGFLSDLLGLLGSSVNYSAMGDAYIVNKIKELAANASPAQINAIKTYLEEKAGEGYDIPVDMFEGVEVKTTRPEAVNNVKTDKNGEIKKITVIENGRREHYSPNEFEKKYGISYEDYLKESKSAAQEAPEQEVEVVTDESELENW